MELLEAGEDPPPVMGEQVFSHLRQMVDLVTMAGTQTSVIITIPVLVAEERVE